MKRKRQVIQVIRVTNAVDIIEAACRLVEEGDVGHGIEALKRAIRPKKLQLRDGKRRWRSDRDAYRLQTIRALIKTGERRGSVRRQ